MHKVALVLALVAIGAGAVTLHLVGQLHEERERTQTLQARVAELERGAPQPGATFVAVPTQPTLSPFTVAEKTGTTQPAPPPSAIAGRFVAAGPMASVMPLPASADQERIREQMNASMERQRELLRDPEYREAMLAQQKMGQMRSNPNLARDLGLSADQADRLFTALAEQQLRSMESSSPIMWNEQPDAAKMQEFQRKMLEQQSANETELKRVLGDGKYREWQEYQSLSGVRWEADRVRASLVNAGVPLDETLAKPLLKTLADQQQKMLQEASKAASGNNRMIAVSGMVSSGDTNVNALQMQEKSLEFMAQHQKRQRDALARVLTPDQLKIVEDEQNAELQMQRAQLRMMRAQQEAGLLDPAGNNVGGFIQGDAVLVPSVSD